MENDQKPKNSYERWLESVERRKKRAREYKRQERAARVALGVCTFCGREDAEPGKKMCWACRLYVNQKRSGAKVH